MRKLTLILNTIVIVFFAMFLSYTFFATSHIEYLARDFVTQKTISYATPSVEFVEESIESPLVQKLLSADQILSIRNEFVEIRNDPSSYISKLTGEKSQDLIPPNANPIDEKMASLKSGIRSFYDGTIQALIYDLRIFSISNLAAGLVAFTLAFCATPPIRKPIIWFSILMFVAVLYCSFMYVDGLSFFRVLFRSHMGWWYPLLLCLVVASLYWDFGHHVDNTNSITDQDASQEQNSHNAG